jgi:hypothetical protein
MWVISCQFMGFEPETWFLHHQMVHAGIAARWKRTAKEDWQRVWRHSVNSRHVDNISGP